MLTIHTKNFTLPLELAPEICESFKEPLIIYLAHKNDWRHFFITFAILDFPKKELHYIVSYLPENIATVEEHPLSSFFQIKSKIANPHCAVLTKKDEAFLAFFETAPFFFQIDWHQNILRVRGEEISRKNSDESAISFSPTVFKDLTDPRYFYFSSIILNRVSRKKALRFYRASLDLSEMAEIYSELSINMTTPHAIRKIDRFIVSSNFLRYQFKNNKTGKIFKNRRAYVLYVYTSLYQEYCKKNNTPYSEQTFQNTSQIKISPWNIQLAPAFDAFCHPKGENFFDLCQKNSAYTFSVLPGSITLLDLENKQKKAFPTTCCSSAHFEIDEKSGDIFVSSHNFAVFDKRYFFGPAAIDRFKLENGELKKIATFSHPTGYRFTCHKVFSYAGKTYLCTFGQPNRLFFVDVETMQVIFHEDIGPDILSQQKNILNFLNSSDLESLAVKAIEISPNGEYIFFMDCDYLYFYSFPKRKIIQKMKYNEGKSPNREIDLSNFYGRTVHTNYLH